ncbi:MAG: cytochrome c biogenesis protein CcsA [Phycisphaeraceae bacterium]|nr:cytochrome c biogenesis protein CcsA [Phycisphaeraceae bacterium]
MNATDPTRIKDAPAGWILAGLAVMVGLLILIMPLFRADSRLPTFRQLPVTGEGRVKPMDTEARVNLMVLSGRQTLERDGKRYPAARWLLEVFSRTDRVFHDEIFRIDEPGLKSLIGQEKSDRKRFSYQEIYAHGQKVSDQTQLAVEVDAEDRSPFQKAVLNLSRQLRQFQDLAEHERPFMVPPSTSGGEWRRLPDAFRADRDDPVVQAYLGLFKTVQDGDWVAVGQATERVQAELRQRVPSAMTPARIEVLFNDLQPFYTTALLYVLVFLFACGSWVAWPTSMRRAAASLLVLALIAHTLGIIARIYLQGRPPVTNLYSSAVFVGWGAVLIGLYLDWMRRDGIGLVAAAISGGMTLLIAHHLGADGDTMEMMQAVLDTNFWLATHVTVITIGYSATFFAGLLGIIWLINEVFFAASTSPARRRDLGRTIYGVICFALMMSFVGTVLGGIWADFSWGRFWGWDPKENGAALVVLVNALALHAWWGGLIRERGLAVLAVSGNIVTAWSWFGTNMLGVGLHSYGFMESAAFWLIAFVVSQLLLMGLGFFVPAIKRKAGTG